jgi:hypothetical protein
MSESTKRSRVEEDVVSSAGAVLPTPVLPTPVSGTGTVPADVIDAPSAWEVDNLGAILGDRRIGTTFSADLFRLLARADKRNLNILRLSAPHHVDAYETWMNGSSRTE